MDALQKLFSSKRFTAALISIAVIVAVKWLKVDEETANTIITKVLAIVMALIGSYKVTDTALVAKGKKKE
jgi:hypothetical protein